MGLLKNTITVEKETFEEDVYKGMTKSLEDAYNMFLSRFENQCEVSYYSNKYLLLTNSVGEVYEIHNYTYAYPTKDSNKIEAYNFFDGLDRIRKVTILNDDVIIEKYNFRDHNAKVSLLKLTKDTLDLARLFSERDENLRSYVAKELANGSYFFMQTLEKQSNIELIELTTDIPDSNTSYLSCDGNIVAAIPGQSFYKNCITQLDYMTILKEKSAKEKEAELRKNKR